MNANQQMKRTQIDILHPFPSFSAILGGAFYHSRYGHTIEILALFENWMILDRFPIRQRNSQKVAEDDPDLLEALRILGLVIGD
jgi:hypothetical protein